MIYEPFEVENILSAYFNTGIIYKVFIVNDCKFYICKL